MSGVERYLKQATRGLSGQARRDASAELRGAIEDKIWRYTLLGLDAGAAQRAALRDLGSPHAVAQGLTRVHTLPKAALGAVLAGVACLLGVQALAAVPVVRAIQDPIYKFCVYDEAYLMRMPPVLRANTRLELAQPGGRAKIVAECKANSPVVPNMLLRLSDIIDALKKGGVGVKTLAQQDGFLYLTFPGHAPERVIDLSDATQKVGGQLYTQNWVLIDRLLNQSDVPLRLTGWLNPVLEVGSARVQLGTTETPVSAADLYPTALRQQLTSLLISKSGTNIRLASTSAGNEDYRNNIAPGANEGAAFVIVDNGDGILDSLDQGEKFYTFRVEGQLAAPFAAMAKGSIVDTPKELVSATRNIRPAVLVYKIDTSDLRNLKLTPVPASQLRGRQAP